MNAGIERVKANVAAVRRRVEDACKRVGRTPEAVTLVGVTKSVGAETLPFLHASGVTDIGENRVLDAIEKSRSAPAGLRWHLIGHLQTNKARKAVGLFQVIHSVDSIRLARILDEELKRTGRTMEAFVEVNSGEEQKSGMEPGDVQAFLEEARGLASLSWVGLMTMAPWSEEAERARPSFHKLRELRDRMRLFHPSIRSLSMGMTNDFEVAVEEGATHIRVGRRIFEGV